MEDLDSGVFVHGKTRDKLRYIFTKAKEKWSDVYWWRKTVFPFVARSIVCFYYQKIVGNKGIYVMEEDWDNLIVLDACRYDLFKEVTDMEVEHRISRGPSTPEFLIENFAGRRNNDTVIVTANPWVDWLVKDSFYQVIPVWKDGWDNWLNTVLPQTIAEHAQKAEKKYPDKRLIIWFMQPHFPFIENPELSPHGYKGQCEITEGHKAVTPIIDPWIEASKGNLEFREVWNGYKSNLEIVLPYAFDLANKLTGKSVITSDHGNAFKRLLFPLPIKLAGHFYRGLYIPELIKVPWVVFDSKERKKIKKGTEEGERIKAKIKELENLGKL